MKISAASIANTPPQGAIVTRAAGRRAEVGAPPDGCIDFVASDPSVGRDGHRILANAWQTENFTRNPVFLFAHDDSEPPLGRVVNLRTVGDRLRALVRFVPRDSYDFAGMIYELYRDGYLNACSTAWLPLEYRAANDRNRPGGLDFTKVELLEISGVPVPALPTALATARSAGIDLTPFVDWTERALDARRPPLPREDLMLMRNAAGARRAYAAPRTSPLDRLAERPRPAADLASGFRSFGEFLQCAWRASTDPAKADRRLTRAPTGAGEVDPSAGGFLVPTTYVDSLVESIYDEAVIAPLCEQITTEHPQDARMPGVDEKSRADGSRWGGAASYWASEGDTVAASLPRWRSVDFSAHKLIAICAATSELLADAPMLEAYMRLAVVAECGFKLDYAILRGTGAGVPLGLLNTAALITIPKANSQASATIIAENVEAMWQRIPAPSRRRAVWLVNEDVENALSTTNSGGLNPTGAALYTAVGVGGNEFPLLKGRPLISIEQAPAIGTPGDIVLADLTQYELVSSPLKMDLSLDILFATDQAMFRFTWRIDGKPLWSTPIAPYNGTLTRSPFIALAAR